jgi:D-glycero-alpha-D-manno-heptose-7-phosphate kinase
MLIARAPFRVSLAGGGTDFPSYYERFGGLVVSTSIDKYVYVHLEEHEGRQVHIASADYQTFYRHHSGREVSWDGDLALPRAVLHELGVHHGLSLFVASEVPPGTGLGSSSAAAVALIRAVAEHNGLELDPTHVSELACDVEIGRLGAPIGKQDQFASAHGGLNVIRFSADAIIVEPIELDLETRGALESRLMLFFTGTARNSRDVLETQKREIADGESQTTNALHRIKEFAESCYASLKSGDLDAVGRLLHESWMEKRRLAPGITNAKIDSAYEEARTNGALGGKIAGAGGGGFLILYCPEASQDAVTAALEERGLRRMEFGLERVGATVTRVQWPQAGRDP